MRWVIRYLLPIQIIREVPAALKNRQGLMGEVITIAKTPAPPSSRKGNIRPLTPMDPIINSWNFKNNNFHAWVNNE